MRKQSPPARRSVAPFFVGVPRAYTSNATRSARAPVVLQVFCPVCDGEFASEKDVFAHLATSHGVSLQQSGSMSVSDNESSAPGESNVAVSVSSVAQPPSSPPPAAAAASRPAATLAAPVRGSTMPDLVARARLATSNSRAMLHALESPVSMAETLRARDDDDDDLDDGWVNVDDSSASASSTPPCTGPAVATLAESVDGWVALGRSGDGHTWVPLRSTPAPPPAVGYAAAASARDAALPDGWATVMVMLDKEQHKGLAPKLAKTLGPLIRKGTPPDLRRYLWLVLSGAKKELDRQPTGALAACVEEVFGPGATHHGAAPVLVVPLLGANALPGSALTPQGVAVARRMLCLLAHRFPAVAFAPIVPHLLALLLTFCTDEEVFASMLTLLSKKERQFRHIASDSAHPITLVATSRESLIDFAYLLHTLAVLNAPRWQQAMLTACGVRYEDYALKARDVCVLGSTIDAFAVVVNVL